MRLTANSKQLAASLDSLRSVIERKGTNPILSNVLIEPISKNKIRLVATDLDNSLSLEASVIEVTTGQMCVSLDRLHGLLKALPDCEINITLKDNFWAEGETDRGKYKIAGLDPEKFPAIPKEEAQSFELEASDLLKGLGRVSHFMGREEHNKYELRGVALELNGSMRFVAANGFGLGVCDIEPSQKFLPQEKPLSWVIPAKAVRALEGFLEEGEKVLFWASDNTLYFKQGDDLLTTRRPTQPGTVYQPILDQAPTSKVGVDREELSSALETISCFSSIEQGQTKYKSAVFTFTPNGLVISSATQEGETASEEVAGSIEGEEFQARLDTFLLRPALKAAHEDVSFLIEPNKFLVIQSQGENEKLTQVITTMRL
jgi:DNA polymerase III subunit beta